MDTSMIENSEEREADEMIEESARMKTGDKEIKRLYTLRPLKDSDLFPLLQILKKLDISEFKGAFAQITEVLTEKNEEEDSKIIIQEIIQKIGLFVCLDMAGIFIANIGRAENEIYNFWSSLSGIPVEEMREMEFGTLPLMIMDTFKSMTGVAFFKVCFKFL